MRRPSRPASRAARPGGPRFFVAGTDTGVGKTQVACALLSLLADEGLGPAAFKPYESGCEDLSAPADALALRAAARTDEPLHWVVPHRLALPLAPYVAARLAGARLDWQKTLKAFRRFDARALVVEAAGGLRVPLDERHDVIDLVEAFCLPVVLIARAVLGTLNHTALSLEALERRRLSVWAVVLSQATPAFDLSAETNADLLRRRHRVPVVGPVAFHVEPERRREAFRTALRPLLEQWLGPARATPRARR